MIVQQVLFSLQAGHVVYTLTILQAGHVVYTLTMHYYAYYARRVHNNTFYAIYAVYTVYAMNI